MTNETKQPSIRLSPPDSDCPFDVSLSKCGRDIELQLTHGCQELQVPRNFAESLARLLNEFSDTGAIPPELDETTGRGVYCHACSVAGGADRPIYHAPPVCKSDDSHSALLEAAKKAFKRIGRLPVSNENVAICDELESAIAKAKQ